MYIDNGDADGHELKIEIDGHEYTAEETESYHHDGTMDTAEVAGDDGGHVAYTDTTHDGTADLATKYDAQGHVVSQEHYNASSGQWEQVSTGQQSSGGNEMITVDTPHGEQTVGPATADTTNSGHNDTAVVTDDQGNTWMYTDTTGDGQADYAMEIDSHGQVTISEHTGEHQWTEVEHGHIDGQGNYHKDAGAEGAIGSGDQFWGAQGTDQTLVRTDSATGEWA